jgi:hypothetical protein
MSVVYVLKREDKPGISKVGRSDNSGKTRAGNYTDGNWKVHKEFEVPVFLAKPIEEKAHVLLKAQGHWLDPEITAGSAREVFTCDPKTAELKVKEAIKIVAIDAKEQSSLLVEQSSSYGEPSTSFKPKDKTFGLLGLLVLSLILIVSSEVLGWIAPFLIAPVVCCFLIWREK